MTLRTYEHFICPNGHRGIEKTTENDQPYSTMWESVAITGMVAVVKDGKSQYRCGECGEFMAPTVAPLKP